MLPAPESRAATPEAVPAPASVTPSATSSVTTTIAGLQPFQRPEGAPVIRQFHQDAAWVARAHTGIAPPYTGLDFLKDQGAWFTPFIHPNLKGGYDIRGLHAAREQAGTNGKKGN